MWLECLPCGRLACCDVVSKFFEGSSANASNLSELFDRSESVEFFSQFDDAACFCFADTWESSQLFDGGGIDIDGRGGQASSFSCFGLTFPEEESGENADEAQGAHVFLGSPHGIQSLAGRRRERIARRRVRK